MADVRSLVSMRRAWLGVLFGLIAACTSGAADGATTTAPPITMGTGTDSTVTTVVETTTTTVAEAVDICRRGEQWTPGSTYRADCFVVPLEFRPEHEGWTSSSAGGDWVKVRWSDPEMDGSEVRGAVLAYRSSDAAENVLDQLTSSELINEVSERTMLVADGMDMLVVDVEGADEPGGEVIAPDGVPCSPDQPVWWRRGRFGHTIVDRGGGVIGVGACHIVRIWVVDVGGTTITILGGSADPDRHDQAVAKIQELFDTMSFYKGGHP